MTGAEPDSKDSAKDKPWAYWIPPHFFPPLKNLPLPAGTCCGCRPQVARLCGSRIRPSLLEKHRAVCPLQVFILVAYEGSREDPWGCWAGEQEGPGATWSPSSFRLLSRTLELEGKSPSSQPPPSLRLKLSGLNLKSLRFWFFFPVPPPPPPPRLFFFPGEVLLLYECTCLVLLSDFFFFFYYLFLAVLGLHCCSWAFCSCGQQASHCRLLLFWSACSRLLQLQ